MKANDEKPAGNIINIAKAIRTGCVVGCLLLVLRPGTATADWPRAGGAVNQQSGTNPPPPVDQDYPVINGHWISLVTEWGAKVKLEDGSVWEIAAKDQSKTRNWLVAQKISVNQNLNSRYPFKLTNTDLKTTADARLTSRPR